MSKKSNPLPNFTHLITVLLGVTFLAGAMGNSAFAGIRNQPSPRPSQKKGTPTSKVPPKADSSSASADQDEPARTIGSSVNKAVTPSFFPPNNPFGQGTNSTQLQLLLNPPGLNCKGNGTGDKKDPLGFLHPPLTAPSLSREILAMTPRYQSGPFQNKIWNDSYDHIIADTLAREQLEGSELGPTFGIPDSYRPDLWELFVDHPPKDIQRLCPKFSALDVEQKMSFWGRFFEALTYQESNFKFQTSLAKDPGGSSGILQVSYKDDPRYGCHNDENPQQNQYFESGSDQLKTFSRNERLYNPETNIRCAMHVMAVQLAYKKTLLDGGSGSEASEKPGKYSFKYWSTLNMGQPAKFKKFEDYFQSETGWNIRNRQYAPRAERKTKGGLRPADKNLLSFCY